MKHTHRWAFMRAGRKKYRQINGAPQGGQFVVGLTQLLGNKKEHGFYIVHPEVKRAVTRMRWLDDIIV